LETSSHSDKASIISIRSNLTEMFLRMVYRCDSKKIIFQRALQPPAAFVFY